MGCSEKDLCIKCEKGGKLLVCSDGRCPLAVHEKCLGCPARFDDVGNFYCPYCLYRQSVARSRQARENVMSRKKDLSSFIDEQMLDFDRQKQKSGKRKGKEIVRESTSYGTEDRLENTLPDNRIQLEEDKQGERSSEHTSVSPFSAAGSSSDEENDLTAVGERNSTKPKRSSSHHLGHEAESVPIVAGGRDDANSEKHAEELRQGGVQLREENGHLCGSPVMEENTSKSTREGLERLNEDVSRDTEEEPETDASSDEVSPMPDTCLEAKQGNSTRDNVRTDLQSVSKQRKRMKQNSEPKGKSSNVDFSRSSPRVRKAPRETEKTNASRKSAFKSPIQKFPHARRKKLLWTEDEEEMLKEGVHIFAQKAKKNMPWRKVLEFGRHVFESSRTPDDLKDKWRNMFAKA